MPKKTDDTETIATEMPAEAPAAPEVPTPSPANLKVLAYFPEHSDGANHHAAQVVASLSQLGVVARVVTGSVVGEDGKPVSRLVAELPE